MGENSFTSKQVNAVTKSVPNSGKSSPTNTESTQPVPTMVTPISNLKESTFTITKPPVVDSSQEPFLWTLSQVPWTPSELAHSVNSSDPTTSFSVRPVPVTTGPRVITPKVLNSLILFSMSLEKKLKAAIASKVSKSPTLSVVVLVLVWVPYSSPKSEKNTPIELWKLSPSSHPPRSLIPLSNPTTPLSPSISSSRTPMSAWSSITKPSTISVSEPLSSPPPPMVILTISSLSPCPVPPAPSVSQVSSTPISENSPSTSFLSPDSISS